jgi:AcrR family transcriptional regulator
MARTKNEELHKKRKNQILAAARTCFIEKGIHTASMQDICKTGKISPGALYRYFPSKKSIIEALAQEEQQQNIELLDYLRNASDPAKALKDATAEILKTITDPKFARLMIEISGEASRDADIHKAFHAVEEEFKNELTTIFIAHRNGRQKAEIEAAIFTYLALLDGITIRAASNDLPPKKHLTTSIENTIAALL